MSELNINNSTNRQNPTIVYAGNPPYGLFGWAVAIASVGLSGFLFVFTSKSFRDVFTDGINDFLVTARGWVLILTAFIVAIRIFTAVFPPRAYALWRDRTPIGKHGRKFARNWRRIIPGLTPVSTGVVVRRHYPGLVSVTEENSQLILTIRYPNERPSGGLANYANEIAQAFKDAYQFASVTARVIKPAVGYNRFQLRITPADLTEEVREWNAV